MQLSTRFNVPWSTINNRYKRGIRGDELVAKKPLSHIEFKGEKVGWTELNKQTGIPITTLMNRYAQGFRDNELINPKHKGALSKNAATKLTESDVIQIKKLLVTSKLTQKEIAKIYNVDPSHISDIKRGKRWAEITVNCAEIIN